MKLRLAAALCLIGLVLPAYAQEKWVEVHSNHFNVITDAGEKKGREVALRFEQMRSIFGSLLQRAKINTPIPMQIIAFRNQSEIRSFSTLFNGKPVEVAGFFQPGQDRHFIALDLSAENAYEAVFHEYAHMLLNANYPRTQLWFDEGFAEYFAATAIERKTVEIGRSPMGAAEILNETKWVSPVELFQVGHDSKVYNESGNHRTLFYSESWMFVHYVLDKRLLEQTAKYFDLTQNQNQTVPDAILQAFGMKPDVFLRAVREYYESNKVVIYKGPTPDINSDLFTAKPMEVLNAHAVLADLHFHEMGYHEQAVTEFEAVLKQDPDNAIALRGLGYAYFQKGDFEKANGYLEHAIQVQAVDPMLLYYHSLLLMRSMSADHPSNPVLIEGEMARATKLNPDFAEGYYMLAFARLRQNKLQPAIDAVSQSIRLDAREERYQQLLGQLYVNTRQWENAEYVFNHLKSSTNPGTAQSAASQLEMIQQLKSGQKVQMVLPEDGEIDTVAKIERPESANPHAAATAETEVSKPDMRAIKYIAGRLTETKCSGPGAILTIATVLKTPKGAKPRIQLMNLNVLDRGKLVLINADEFSCAWKNKEVSVNYKAGNLAGEASSLAGDAISVEVH